jgi:molybdenum cofactor cytidylyltransferase
MNRSFAIIPAAGKSTRMGAPKLLLPLRDRPVIDHVLKAWTRSLVAHTVIIVREHDERLLDRCRRFDVDIVVARQPPPDMKASIQLGLDHVQARYRPAGQEPWLVAPADSPRLSADLINALLRAYDPAAPAAIVPVIGDRRAHPALLPWSESPRLAELAPSDGFNRLLTNILVRQLPWYDSSIADDFNTPADYARLVDAAAQEYSSAGQSSKEVIDAA